MPKEIPITSFDAGKREEVEMVPGELQKVDLGQLADWIDEYGKKFGPFARLGRAGAFLTEAEQEEKLLREDRDPEEREIQLAKKAQTEIVQRNKKLAEEVGLSLDFPSGTEEAEWALEMRLDVGDGKKFIAYLHSLRKVTESQAKGLAKIADILATQLTTGYDLTNPEDERLLELAASLKGVTLEYKRIATLNPSLEFNAALLEEVYQSLKDGYLKEYILAKEAQFLDPVERKTFGPGRWHTDTTEEGYIQKWNNALQTLSEIALNPKAKELYEKARNNLLTSLEYAEKDMTERKSSLLHNKISGFIEATRKRLQS